MIFRCLCPSFDKQKLTRPQPIFRSISEGERDGNDGGTDRCKGWPGADADRAVCPCGASHFDIPGLRTLISVRARLRAELRQGGRLVERLASLLVVYLAGIV